MNPRPIASCSLFAAFALIAAACNKNAQERTGPAPAPSTANAQAEFDLGKPA